tara:strand:+ start:1884 stop:2492 length:609 start_codon:yes stop_codon:yes gene_type:complete
MNIPYSIFILFSVLFFSCSSRSENKRIEGIEIPTPENWIDKSEIRIKDNLANYNLKDEEISKLLKNHNGSVPVVIYTKYEPSQFNGPIPTIQVLLRPNNTKNINSFKKTMEPSLKQMADALSKFKILSLLEIIEIDGFKALKFVSQFDMPFGEDESYTIRSWTYAIPAGKHFYQINFSDTENEDNEKIYAQLITQIKLKKQL